MNASPALPPGLSLHIDPLQDRDIARIRQIEEASFEQPWKTGAYAAELQNPTTLFLVARLRDGSSGNLVVGYIGLWVLQEELHVTTIATDPHWQRRGIAQQLLMQGLEVGREKGALRATLEVRRGNLVARRLYERLGFVVTGVRPRYYLDNGEDAFILWIHDLWSPEFCVRLRRLQSESPAGSQV